MDPIFLSFVPSSAGPDGYPIEVAWAFGKSRYEDHLIRPSDHWINRRRGWDRDAEAKHGFSREFLVRQGELPSNVAIRMNTIMEGQRVLSGDPVFARRQLSQLFEVSGQKPSFEIARTSTETMIADLARRLGLAGHGLESARGKAWRILPTPVNALSDAMFWASFWQFVAAGLDDDDQVADPRYGRKSDSKS